MDKPTTPFTADWVRCESRTHRGRYYMFNPKTGETKWCSCEETEISTNIISAKDIVKTPAQDRLKRLQNNLGKRKPNAPSSNRHTKNTNTLGVEKLKVPETKKDSASSAANNITYSKGITSKKIVDPNVKPSTLEQTKINVASKRQLSTATDGNSSETTLKRKFVIPKKPALSSESGIHATQKAFATLKKPSEMARQPIPKSTLSNPQKMSVKNSPRSRHLDETPISEKDVHSKGNSAIVPDKSCKLETNNNSSGKQFEQRFSKPSTSESNLPNIKPLKAEPKPGLMSMVKGFCEKIINRATKEKKRKPPENKDREKMSNISSNSKTSFKQRKPGNGSVIRGILLENENSSKTKKQSPLQLNISPTERTVSSPIPVPNISANDRLQRLRGSLHLQQKRIQMPATSFTFSFSLDVSNVSSSQDYASVSSSDCEPMDWQPTEELSPSLVHSSSVPVTHEINSCSPSEHYDAVNENLLRLAADKKRNNWKTDHFYFIVDTNVFINSPMFVDELIHMKLCDTMGTIIYVPYCVLQELDKLKIRSPSESVKTRSARAIKFLNKCFEDKDQHIQAQNAVDEKQHLIEVSSPDDSILNCCLQVKKYVDNMLLLTEDNNLRNKALCSDILVSTKSDLISKHESRL